MPPDLQVQLAINIAFSFNFRSIKRLVHVFEDIYLYDLGHIYRFWLRIKKFNSSAFLRYITWN